MDITAKVNFGAQLIGLLVLVAVLVILIVILSRNTLSKCTLNGAPCDGTTTDGLDQKITLLDNKITTLYILEIVAVSISILMALFSAVYIYYK